MGMSPREVAQVRARLVAIGMNLRELTEISSQIKTRMAALAARQFPQAGQDARGDR